MRAPTTWAGVLSSSSRILPSNTESVAADLASSQRFRELFEAEYNFVWRCLRRLGVELAAVDDCAQDVFWVASRRLDGIEAGKERAFLFGTALRTASGHRRKRARSPIAVLESDDLHGHEHPGPSPEQCLERKRARELLDLVLDKLEDDQRAVFVLFELEGMTMASIADTLEVPPGTVASRLRRAREHFQREVSRLQARNTEVSRATTPERSHG